MKQLNSAAYAIGQGGEKQIVYILEGPYFMSIAEASKRSGISKERIYDAVKSGKLISDKSGNQNKVSLKDVIEHFTNEAKETAVEERRLTAAKRHSKSSRKRNGSVFNLDYVNAPVPPISEE